MDNLTNIDTLLKTSAPRVPLRPNLAAQTLALALQARRVQRIKRLQAALMGLAAVLLAAKWHENDVYFLVQLVATKFEIVRSQSSLYWGAAWESLPKAQVATLAALAGLWLGWRKFETMLLRGRITTTKPGRTMKLIKVTPRLAVASLLLGIAALGISGYTYAQSAELRQLEILRTYFNQSGRTQLDTSGTTTTCTAHPWSNETATFEIKKGSQLRAADAVQIARAACLQATAEASISKHFAPHSQLSGTPVYQVTKRQGNKLTLLSYYGGQANTRSEVSPQEVFNLETNSLATSKAIVVGSLIMPQGGAAVILPLTPAISWYDPTKLNQLTRLNMCAGNTSDTCSFTGSIDFFPAGGGEDNSFNRAALPAAQDRRLSPKEIAGTIIEIAPTYTTIKSSSGRLFTANFGSNPAAEFNRNRAQHYQNQPVTLGDTLRIRYVEAPDQHSTTIAQDHITGAVLMIEFANKTDPLKKY